MCNSETLLGIFSIIKRVMLLIQIIVPILLIVFASISLIKLLKNPEEKNSTKKIINQFISAVIVFFIPLLVNVVMNLAGDSNNISSCWNSASDKNIINTTYKSSGEKERKKITYDATNYDSRTSSGNLDFSCTSNIVKSQFSCETLKIVEKHLYDLNAQNFNKKIASYRGFENYAKSIGGIFGEYYGKKMPHETEADFQRAAEYVLGWMYMYGWDYKNGFAANEGEHKKWGNHYYKNYAPDAFYVNGGWIGKYVPDNDSESQKLESTNFDHIISGENGGVGRMSSECGDGEVFIYNKLGISRKGKLRLHNYTKLKDLKVGDVIGFWHTSKPGGHVAVIGETYDDRIVIYDASYMVSSMNYKRVLYFPKENTVEADREVIKNEFKIFNAWGSRRYWDFKTE